MKILDGDTRGRWTDRLIDPLIVQAERFLASRQVRDKTLGPDLFGEPAWEILLSTFITAGHSRVCVVHPLADELHLSQSDMRNWIVRLSERGLIEDLGVTIAITPRAEAMMRDMFAAHHRSFSQDFGGGDGLLHFSSGRIAKGT
ncbi:MAG: hypothetical protein ABJK59_00915 [Erythrobacter sp.]|uniref:hypothetical protein n=1 Tax=Erythrobacter sp. TaxID=1042 RepID=UPI0032992818